MSYERQKLLGEGAFGKVYKAIKDNKYYALKSTSFDNQTGIHFTTIRELRILQMLKHKNIAKYIETFLEDENIFIVQIYYPFDLSSLMKLNFKFTSNKIYHILFEIISGLKFIHSKNIIHRDLKPANIFLNAHGIVKIGDFGISREVGKLMTNGCTTLVYRSPELLLGCEDYSMKVDQWGLGCIIYEFFEKSPPFEENCELTQIIKIIKTMGLPKQKYPFMDIIDLSNINIKQKNIFHLEFCKKYSNFFYDKLKNLINKTLQIDPSDRWTTQQLYDLFDINRLMDIRSLEFNRKFKEGISK